MRLLAELKRRNVIRMAGLYLVGSWLIVQVAETLLPIFDTPGWVLKALVVLLAIGFLPALVFSWVFELTPEGLKREREVDRSQSIVDHTAHKLDVAVIVLLIGVGAMLLWQMRGKPEPAAPTTLVAIAPARDTPAQADSQTVTDKSIAVRNCSTRSIARCCGTAASRPLRPCWFAGSRCAAPVTAGIRSRRPASLVPRVGAPTPRPFLPKSPTATSRSVGTC